MGEKPKRAAREENHDPNIKRPIDPQRVLRILEYRRKTLSFVESMLKPEIHAEDLRLGETFICKSDYDNVVQERFILKLCGYPLCPNKLIKEWKQKYHVSLRDKRIYDVEVRKLYCSVRCMDVSTQYRESNLPEQPIWMRPGDTLDLNHETPMSNL